MKIVLYFMYTKKITEMTALSHCYLIHICIYYVYTLTHLSWLLGHCVSKNWS